MDSMLIKGLSMRDPAGIRDGDPKMDAKQGQKSRFRLNSTPSVIDLRFKFQGRSDEQGIQNVGTLAS